MSDTIYWIWLSQRLGAGNAKLLYLIERYSSPLELFLAESEEIEGLEVSDSIKEALSDKDMREAYAVSDYCAKNGIGIVTFGSSDYPSPLRALRNPPCVLYVKGELGKSEDSISIAMVGTRTMSEYGTRSAYKIAYELASAGVTVISGMALGIDAVSACGAISAGGRTIAVLGGGVDVVYPREHAVLYERIIKNGAVISEYPPTSRPRRGNFPMRNRIISGLSNGALIVECDKISGAMITARYALEQGKDLFALPGEVGAFNATGTNLLLRNGANIVLTSNDILETYNFYFGHLINYTNLSFAKSHSQLDINKLKEMGICSMDSSFKTSEELDGQNNPKNILRPTRPVPNSVLKKRIKTENSAYEYQETAEKEPKRKPKTNTEQELETLNEKQREILLSLPDDSAISLDKVMRMGYTCDEAIGALAVLEVKGFIDSLPGGLYMKK